jgi:outer membrane protein
MGLCLLGPSLASAEDLMEIYQQALSRDAAYQAAQAAYLAAREAKPQARSFLLPQINAQTSVDRQHQDLSTKSGTEIITRENATTSAFNNIQYGISLSQVIFNREFFVGLDQAEASVAQAEAEVEAARQELILRVAQAYFDVLGAQDTLQFTQAEKEAVARQLDQAKKRFEVGLTAITDVKESQANYDRTVSDEIVAKNQIEIARNTLAVIIGRYFGDLGTLSERMRLLSPDPEDINQWIDKAFKENLQLIATGFATDTARLEIKRQRSGHYPTLDLRASANRQEIEGGFTERDQTDLNVGVQLNLPIYSGGLINSRTREAQHGFQQAQELYIQQRRDTAKQARDSYLNVISGISEVRALRRSLESAQTAAEATDAGFAVGTRTSVDVLVALQGLFRAQRDHALSRYRYLLNTLRLKQAAGILTAEDLNRINAWLD